MTSTDGHAKMHLTEVPLSQMPFSNNPDILHPIRTSACGNIHNTFLIELRAHANAAVSLASFIMHARKLFMADSILFLFI